MLEKIRSWIKFIYCVFLLVLPVVAAVVVGLQAETLRVDLWWVHFLQSSFFLVGLFNLFFLILYHEYLPDNLLTLCSLLFGPIIVAAGHALVAPNSFWFTLAEAGMIYTIEIILAFALLMVIILVLATLGSLRERDLSGLGGALLVCGLQLLFLIPGGGALYIFSQVIIENVLQEIALANGAWSVLSVVSYGLLLATIVENIWAFFHGLKDKSILD